MVLPVMSSRTWPSRGFWAVTNSKWRRHLRMTISVMNSGETSGEGGILKK